MIELLFDIVFSTSALLILFPIVVPILILLSFSGLGEVFFFTGTYRKK